MVVRIAALALGLVGAFASFAHAEVKEVRLSKQFGLGYLSMIVIESRKLIEKHASAASLGEVTTVWMQHSGPNVQIDALLAGQVDFIRPGVR
jgi:NitT/TauT family transport system substrate-binding protein